MLILNSASTFENVGLLATADKPVQWEGKGAQLFGGRTHHHEGSDGEDSDQDPEQGPDVHFTPLVSLPEVKVSTGEEDEQVSAHQS